ncbi:hypothetical protein SAMN05216214_11372 [Atopomonas hussainii]|uniref:ABC transporter permease n=1 Tax=Atopomonas hussainii TaxID=1429083 RepID=A0A1H7QUQ6_9GAMM|nr:hypothetical protein [Atopomonas hussainii]SEL51468.1 hypothetical protein SAMN05216214_11372 [Atopomonas hussainii]
MLEILRLGLKAGWRGLGWRVLLPLAALVVVISLLASGFSGRQPTTVALDVGLSALRVALLILALLWVQELFAKDIERKTVYFVLAYPVSREGYLFARFAAVAILSLFALFMVGSGLWLSLVLSSGFQQVQSVDLAGKYFLVMAGLWLDVLVVASFAMLAASFSTTPFLPLLMGLAFGLAARGLGPTLNYLLNSERSDPLQASIFAPVLEYSYAWLPDLSRLDFRPLALYDLSVPWLPVGLALLNGVLYMLLTLFLAGFIFKRRNFV